MPATCLIAEADPFIANLLLRYAEESGVRTAWAKTGRELSALVHQIRPDLLIVEPELPGEQRGWEVVQALRSNGAIGSLTVVSCSWLEKAEACRLLGAVAWHLQKPNLYYSDFVTALEAAGIPVEEHQGWSGQSD